MHYYAHKKKGELKIEGGTVMNRVANEPLGAEVYPCEKCDYVFVTKLQIKNHIARGHKIMEELEKSQSLKVGKVFVSFARNRVVFTC